MNKKFLDAMGNIDDELITQAKEPVGKKKYKKWWGAAIVAACFVCVVAVQSGAVSTLANNIAQLFRLHSNEEQVAEVELTVNKKIKSLEEKYYANIDDMAKETGIRILDISDEYKTGKENRKMFWYYPRDNGSWLRISDDIGEYFKIPDNEEIQVMMNAYAMMKEPAKEEKKVLDWNVYDFDDENAVAYTSSVNGLEAHLVVQDTKNPEYKDERDNLIILTYDNIAYFYYLFGSGSDIQNLDMMKKFVDALIVY